jgi:malonyl-CoA/methylmalonyl-CoA synthetase
VLVISRASVNAAAADVSRVEGILSKHANVMQCAVLAVANEFGANELCALVVPRSYLDGEALRSYCKTHLPGGLVPTRFVAVSELPRKIDSTIDRAQLLQVLEGRKT